MPNFPDDVAREAYSHEVTSVGLWFGNREQPGPGVLRVRLPDARRVLRRPRCSPPRRSGSARWASSCCPTTSVAAAEDPDERAAAVLRVDPRRSGRAGRMGAGRRSSAPPDGPRLVGHPSDGLSDPSRTYPAGRDDLRDAAVRTARRCGLGDAEPPRGAQRVQPDHGARAGRALVRPAARRRRALRRAARCRGAGLLRRHRPRRHDRRGRPGRRDAGLLHAVGVRRPGPPARARRRTTSGSRSSRWSTASPAAARSTCWARSTSSSRATGRRSSTRTSPTT